MKKNSKIKSLACANLKTVGIRFPKNELIRKLLKKLNLINKNSKKLKILGTGEVKVKVNIEADQASKSAIKKLEKIGGSLQLKK